MTPERPNRNTLAASKKRDWVEMPFWVGDCILKIQLVIQLVRRYREVRYTWKETGIGKIDNLGRQFAKVMQGANQGSISTRHRYADAGARFIKFAAERFNLQKIQNIQDKHLESYTKELQERGKSHKYIKNELSAIRYIHRQTPQAKYELTPAEKFNRQMGLEKTPDGRADRAWKENEINAMKENAIECGKPDIVNLVEAIRSTGMRLDEACTVRRDQLEAALRTGKLHLENTKGGRPRDIPVNERARELFQKVLPEVKRGEYAFVPRRYVQDHKIHAYKKNVQDFFEKHRDKFQDPDRKSTAHNLKPGEKGAITAHGLRHSYAREEYHKLLDLGFSKNEARKEIAERMGHSRAEVTKIYTLD